jgi:hypothetical protein
MYLKYSLAQSSDTSVTLVVSSCQPAIFRPDMFKCDRKFIASYKALCSNVTQIWMKGKSTLKRRTGFIIEK